MAKRAIKEFEIMRTKNIGKNVFFESIKERCNICNEVIHGFIKDNRLPITITQPISEYKNIKTYNGKHVCNNCYNAMNCIFIHNHRSNGKKLNIEDIEEIKVRFEHYQKRYYSTKINKFSINTVFTMKCYIKLKSLKNIRRHKNIFGSENEISINDEFTPYCLPSYDEFYYKMIKHANRARLKEKQKIMKNEKLIKYMYNCMMKTLEIGVDKKIFGL